MSTSKPCPLCDSTGPWRSHAVRAEHIRAHHTVDCPVCHEPVNASGITAHLRYIHRTEEAAAAAAAGPATEAPEPAEATVPPELDQPEPPAPEPVLELDQPEQYSCPDCGAGPWDTRQKLGAHRSTHTKVECPDCGQELSVQGLGSHQAAHRRSAGATQARADTAERAAPLAAALGQLLPGAAPELVDRLATYVAQHRPGPQVQFVAATATEGPWLCRATGVGLIATRARGPLVVVALADIATHLNLREQAA